jgi:hypothetical protein
VTLDILEDLFAQVLTTEAVLQKIAAATKQPREERTMSDEQQSQSTTTTMQAAPTSGCPHPEAVGKRWGDLISPERQAELQGYLERWQAETDHGERKKRVGRRDAGPPHVLFPRWRAQQAVGVRLLLLLGLETMADRSKAQIGVHQRLEERDVQTRQENGPARRVDETAGKTRGVQNLELQ